MNAYVIEIDETTVYLEIPGQTRFKAKYKQAFDPADLLKGKFIEFEFDHTADERTIRLIREIDSVPA